MKKVFWLGFGVIVGLTTLSVAMGAVPASPAGVTDDTAIYQHLSEIKAPRLGHPNFDGDIRRLADLEPRYREKLPSISRHPRLATPMKRITTQPYHYSGARKKPAPRN